ncbi:MAG: hypothetical protein OXQ29_08975 [Rhodospirillaceae bacterium]|nr:hypothetical protein [Rhodospirillaceae bacterium]
MLNVVSFLTGKRVFGGAETYAQYTSQRKQKFLTPLPAPQEKRPAKDTDERKLPVRRDIGEFQKNHILVFFSAKRRIFVDEAAPVYILGGVISFA